MSKRAKGKVFYVPARLRDDKKGYCFEASEIRATAADAQAAALFLGLSVVVPIRITVSIKDQRRIAKFFNLKVKP